MRQRDRAPNARLFPTAPRLIAVAVVFATLVVAQAAQAKTFAFKATGKGGTIYLMGSIHVMSESFYPLNPVLEAAFKDSDLLVEEVDLAELGFSGIDPEATGRPPYHPSVMSEQTNWMPSDSGLPIRLKNCSKLSTVRSLPIHSSRVQPCSIW